MPKRVKIQITKSGLYGADGAIPVGSQFTVDEDTLPSGWKGKYSIMGKGDPDTMIVNPGDPNVAAAAKAALDAQAEADAKEAAEKQAEADKKAKAAEKAAAEKEKADEEARVAAEKKKADEDAAKAAAQNEPAPNSGTAPATTLKLPGQK